MVYLPTEVEVPQTFLYLSFSALYYSSLGRTDTIVFSELDKPPPRPLNRLEIDKPPRELNRGFTVLNLAGSTVK